LSGIDGDITNGAKAFHAKYYEGRPKAPPLRDVVDEFEQIRYDSGGFVPRRIVDEATCAVVAQRRVDGLWVTLRVEITPDGTHEMFEPAMPEGNDALPPRDDADFAQRAAAVFDALAARDRFAGTVVIVHDGKTILARAWGLANRAWSAPNQLDTKFNLGSMNKMFTAVSILQLVERGKVSLDDSVGKWLPDWPNAEVREKVTVRMLLTHSSGLGSYWNEEFERRKLHIRAVADYFPTFAKEPLQFAPGAHFGYSNAGFIVLGAIVEKAAGEDYFEYVRRHVYAPSGMSNSDSYDLSEEVPQLALGYTHADAEGNWTNRWHNNLFLHVVKGGPAGGGYSTSSDLVRFAQALVAGKLLRPATFQQMSAKQIAGRDAGYGFGMGRRDARGTIFVGHAGGFAGVNSELDFTPDGRWIFAVMSNVDFGADMVAHHLRDLATRR
jgi:CubicO group peptidase (beta-lactamase class C family)